MCQFITNIVRQQYVEFKYFALKCKELDLNQPATLSNTQISCIFWLKNGVLGVKMVFYSLPKYIVVMGYVVNVQTSKQGRVPFTLQ